MRWSLISLYRERDKAFERKTVLYATPEQVLRLNIQIGGV
jgi:hypothetical protein